MAFLGRGHNSPRLSTRIYVHEHLGDLFKRYKDTEGGAIRYGLRAVKDNRKRKELRDTDYFIGVVWGDTENNQKVCDLFAYSDLDPGNWPGNPDVSAWVIRDGVFQRENPITCGDTLLVLGIEEEWRRNCKNLREYLSRDPYLTSDLKVIQH